MDWLLQATGLWDGDDPRNKAIPSEKWDTRDHNQNLYDISDPRHRIRKTTNRWSKKGSEIIDRIPEPVKEIVGGVTNVVGGGLFGEGGLLRSDMNPLGLQPVDALRAVDAGFETTSKLTGINRNVLETGEALVPFVPPTAKLTKTVTKRAGQKVINELTEAAFRAAPPDSVIGMTYRTGGGFGVVPSDDWFLKNSDEFIDTPAFPVEPSRNVLTISDEYRAIPKTTEITNKMLDEQLLIRQEVDDVIAKYGGIDKVPKHKLDKLYSRKSTTTEILPNDIEFYNQNKAFKDKYVQYEDTVNKLGTLEWHHKNMKAVSAPFLDRAWEIVRAGGGTQADILNLHQLALNHGVGMGDRMSALLPMGRVPHQKLHNWAKATGIQPTPAQIKEIAEKLKGVNNMEDLTRIFNQELEKIAIPMTREAKIMEAVWQDLSPLKRSQLADLYQKRDKIIRSITQAKKKGLSTTDLEKQKKIIDKKYYAIKDPLVEEFFENRPKYGDYTDEYGVLKPEGSALTPGYEGRTTGYAEQTRERAIDSLHDLVKNY